MKPPDPDRQRIISVLYEVEESAPVGEACRRAGISPFTFYRWRKRFGGLMPSQLRRLKELERERQARFEDARQAQSGKTR